MTSIQEGLKNSDWATRKAACVALGDIASVGGAFFSVFKSSSIPTLESCRFDKNPVVRHSFRQGNYVVDILAKQGSRLTNYDKTTLLHTPPDYVKDQLAKDKNGVTSTRTIKSSTCNKLARFGNLVVTTNPYRVVVSNSPVTS
ncbi:hypothetical protein KY290_028067 [Solanum tuberosum]|uniref:TORTIFOLIA1/SINE1-2 N-terminal domain-containing protein n=1 Tax=Solanum tuberosum TaxID=4113 RepID=A0ABQ7UGT3_SOLTU|nr:hypothetical protein KY290_028067 [Solanum tuberosum]